MLIIIPTLSLALKTHPNITSNPNPSYPLNLTVKVGFYNTRPLTDILAVALHLLCSTHTHINTHTHTHTHTHTTILQLFGFCPGQAGEPVPEETFTHSHSSLSSLWSKMYPVLNFKVVVVVVG